MKLNNIYNRDCMEAMKEFPDNYFELAIVDPPYGIQRDGQKLSFNPNKRKHNRKHFEFKGWDQSAPDKVYFDELFRISTNQIIWGGNYFDLPPSKGIIIWDKGQKGLNQSDGELAWSSQGCLRIWVKNRVVLLQEGTIHPTQKPVKLYEWLLKNYAQEGDKILDTHLGSCSSIIACINMGFDFIGFELDEEYFKLGKKRINQHLAQGDITRAAKFQNLQL